MALAVAGGEAVNVGVFTTGDGIAVLAVGMLVNAASVAGDGAAITAACLSDAQAPSPKTIVRMMMPKQKYAAFMPAALTRTFFIVWLPQESA